MIKTNHVIDFENSIGPWLGMTTKIVDYHLSESFKKHKLDLSKEQMIVLKKLHNKDGQIQNDLAYLTLRDKSSLARLLSKMEKKKYIHRLQDQEDKRINKVYLTEAGKEIFERTKPVLKVIINTMEQNISEEERIQFINTLKKIQENLGENKPTIVF